MDKKTVKELESILDKKLDQKLAPINSKLDALTLDIIEVQRKTDVIGDIHEIIKDTRDTVKDHEQRIEILENAA